MKMEEINLITQTINYLDEHSELIKNNFETKNEQMLLEIKLSNIESCKNFLNKLLKKGYY